MPKYAFDHVHLSSPDPVATAEFYKTRFGAKQMNDPDPAAERFTINLDLSGVTLLVSKAREGAPTGLGHFGIRSDDLDSSIEEFKGAGVPFTMEKTEVRPDFTISFITAPDDVSIELQQGSL